MIPVRKKNWHIESLDPSLKNGIGFVKVLIPVVKRGLWFWKSVSIAKTRSRSSLHYTTLKSAIRSIENTPNVWETYLNRKKFPVWHRVAELWYSGIPPPPPDQDWPKYHEWWHDGHHVPSCSTSLFVLFCIFPRQYGLRLMTTICWVCSCD